MMASPVVDFPRARLADDRQRLAATKSNETPLTAWTARRATVKLTLRSSTSSRSWLGT